MTNPIESAMYVASQLFLYPVLIAIALRWGLDPNDLKLVTAAFVFAALVLPNWFGRLGRRIFGGRHA